MNLMNTSAGTLNLPKLVRRPPGAVVLLVMLSCFAILPARKALAVSPLPDGGYPNNNTAEGTNALFNLTTGTDNTATGFYALLANTTGSVNTATGSGALQSNTTGNYNTASGVGALSKNTAGNFNVATGIDALRDNTTGNANTATGAGALQSNTTGGDNTATGSDALLNNTSGGQNTATGEDALGHNGIGNDNTANGFQSLQSNSMGSYNTANGVKALQASTTANYNTASGALALLSNTTGAQNTATGSFTLQTNTVGQNNTATGLQALFNNTSGNSNTAEGMNALFKNTTGANNVALGASAGSNLTTGSNNIDIGTNVLGNTGEANTIRIGKQGTQKSAFVAGIFGTPLSGSTVVVNSAGKLGVASSSARFKEAIKPMDKASESILALRPVTFRYKDEIDPEGIPQFGLIAEEVENVNPALVGRDETGKVATVRYEAVNAMLLNEFLKSHRIDQDQTRKLQQQEATIDQLKTMVAEQQKQIKALAATLQESMRPAHLAKTSPLSHRLER